jgi:poly[(R)-3-hydroxyalkanoate] polymerase subunit PhaE
MPDKAGTPGNIWDRWPEMQADMFRSWMDAWGRMWGARQGDEAKSGEEARPDAMELYKNWQDGMKEMMERFAIPTEGLGPGTYQRMFQSGDLYARLYSIWRDVYESYRKAVGEGGYDFETMRKVLDTWAEDYKKIVQEIFAPALPEQLRWIAELYSGDVPVLASSLLMHLWAPWYEYSRRLAERQMKLEQPSLEGAVEFYEGWRKAYEESLGRFLRAPVMGYYREAEEKLAHTLDSLTEFNIVLSEFYASIENTGLKGFEKLQERLAAMQQEGENEPMSFRDLYRLWWQTNEDIYIELFRTEEFSKILGQLVDRGMQFRADFQAYVEEATKELPFPNRSEMDHLYKTVHGLRHEVRRLSGELEEIKARGKV